MAGTTGVVLGIGASLLAKLINVQSWSLINEESAKPQLVTGQFPANSMTREVTANWAQVTSLNRQAPILQFIGGNLDTFALEVTLFRRDASDPSPNDKLEALIEWTRIDAKKRRPPILTFALGSGLGITLPVVLEGITGISYGQPNALGGVTKIDFTLNLRQFVEFNLDDPEVLDTRYATVKKGQYYERLAQIEYGDALLGVVVRQRSAVPLLTEGDRVALSAIEGIRTAEIKARSHILKTAFGNSETPQRARRLAMFAARNRTRVSYFFNSPVKAKQANPAVIPVPPAATIAATAPTGWWRYDTAVDPVPVGPGYNQQMISWGNQGSVGGSAVPVNGVYPFSATATPRTAASGVRYDSKADNMQQGTLADYISVSEWTSAVLITSDAAIIDSGANTFQNPAAICDIDGGWGIHIARDATIGPSGFDSFRAQAYFWDGAAGRTVEVLVPGGDNNSEGPYLLVSYYDSATTNMTMTVYDLSSIGSGVQLVGTATAPTAVLPPASIAGNISLGNNKQMVNSTHGRVLHEALTWQRVLSVGEIQTVSEEHLARWGGP